MKNPEALSLAVIGQLYAEHHPWLVKWLYRHLGCPHNAADLAQDTFTRVLTAREKLYVDEAKALLTLIAKGLVVDHYRRSALEQAFQDALASLPEASEPSPEAQALALEAVLAVDRMLAELPGNVRKAFLLSRIDGLSYAEIADRLEVSVSSVQQYMLRAYAACYAAAYPA
ncbi:sigma-70 family RNA polymerase sigma factor [Methylobacillus flagellatus]|uniref:sigma-70 family RNA polymerase sigma factor n=1 Tax=Methylobacillus flagellatus TaxID=405 RepID=UPI0028541B73|nr:sigma-70 family RNA polymerase sigma factor [Methylobacillus flagellatus]MDR5171332.1 sigma-70 family RNA polymerase sigma factor [Methylobacillus flagellatus]